MFPFNTTVAILGTSFSGSLVAAHLLKTANRPLTFIPRAVFGLYIQSIL